MNRPKILGLGVLAIVAAIVFAAIPRSEGYSTFGFGLTGRVDVECGSVFNPEQNVDFSSAADQRFYFDEKSVFGEPRVFEGKTETEVCDDVLKAQRITSIVLGVGGVGALVVALFGSSLVGLLPAGAGSGSSADVRRTGANRRPQSSKDTAPTGPPAADRLAVEPPAMTEIDEPTRRAIGLLESARSQIPYYLAPHLFLAAALAFLTATLADEGGFWSWGSIGYLKGIILITGSAAAAGLRGNGRYPDLVAAIGSAYLLGDGMWRLFAGVGPVWIRIMLTLADLAILVGLIEFLERRGPPPNRAGARDDHARIVLVGCGLVTLCLFVLAAQRYFGNGFAHIVHVLGFWGLCMAAITVALLIRSRDMLIFAGVLAAMRFVLLFVGRYGSADGAWSVLSKAGLAAVAAFAAWQFYVDRQHMTALVPLTTIAGHEPVAASPAPTPHAVEPGNRGVDEAAAPVVFSTDRWSTEEYRAVVERLRERGVIFGVEDGHLSVDPVARRVTELVVDEVTSPDR